MDKYSLRALRVAGVYAIFGVLWIVFSDRILAGLAGDAAELSYVQTIKGILYIAVTAGLVYYLARRVLLEQDRLHERAEQSEKQFRSTFEQAAVGIGHVAPDGAWIRANAKMCAFFGYAWEELRSHDLLSLTHPDDLAESKQHLKTLLGGEVPSYGLEKRYITKQGVAVWAAVTVSLSLAKDGSLEHIVVALEDIGPRKRAEEEHRTLTAELQQAQKMEAVGRLAGGVAHDFNNMLSVITGYTDSVLERVEAGSAIAHDLHEVRLAADRSAALTRQLLAFARKERVNPRPIDVHAHVANSRNLLARLAGEQISLEICSEQSLWTVNFDPTQLDQVLANLVVNSRDAIAGKGAIRISLQNVELDEAACAGFPGATAGSFVLIEISDTGCGMTEEVLQHVFEPFFTTKDAGKGTGLGLSTVFGIVQRCGGVIAVSSTPGEGTTFRVYLPRHAAGPANTSATPSKAVRGKETVLLVEDERTILNLLRRVLESNGYSVVAFSDPLEAEKALDGIDGVDLLVTDVLMPGMNGAELSTRVLAAHPKAKLIYMSGHTADVILEHGLDQSRVNFLEKPFAPSQLLLEVRRVLDGAAAGA